MTASRLEISATLQAYLKEYGNTSSAARRLYLNRHYLMSRLRKIETLTGRDLGNTDERLLLDVSLRLCRLTEATCLAEQRQQGRSSCQSREPFKLELEEFARRAGQHFSAGFRDPECLADYIAEIVIDPVAKHKMECHVRLKFRRIPLLEASCRLQPIYSDRIATTRFLREALLLNRTIKGSGDVAADASWPDRVQCGLKARDLSLV